MKKIYSTAVCTLAFAMSAFAQNANVSLSNLSSNNGFLSYDNGSKVISDIFFEVLSDGDNSNNVLDDFQVSLYLLECDASGSATSNTPIVIKTYDIYGMQQLHAIDYSNETVDLDDVAGLNEGLYRLGVWVNSDGAIPNPPDDPSDNAGLLKADDGTMQSSIINFASSTAIAETGNTLRFSVFPNPANEWLTIKGDAQLQNKKILVFDLLGNCVIDTQLNDDSKVNISNLPAGIYHLNAGGSSRKFVKM